MAKITIEFEVAEAQEIASTLRTVVSKIDWTLENKPPQKRGALQDLDDRAKLLTIAATTIETALHQRALGNVVKIADKK
jgi:hypothetical protein